MLKANFKSVFFITLITTSVWLGGCNSPEEKKAAQIKDALSLSEKGSKAEALKILEELATQYPDDTVILKSIGQIYAADGDAGMASLFLEQAYLKSPDDTELLFQTYQSLDAAKQPASHLLEKLAERAPEAMTPELWTRLGQARQAANQVQPALDAFLKGVDPDKAKPAPETAAAIGQLFVQVGNLPQAESWLKMGYILPNKLCPYLLLYLGQPGYAAPGYGQPAPGYGQPAPGYGQPAPGGFAAPGGYAPVPTQPGYYPPPQPNTGLPFLHRVFCFGLFS